MKIIYTLFTVLLFSISCSSPSSEQKDKVSNTKITTEQHSIEEEEEWVPDEYKTSELAELMRTMHTNHLDLKKKIEAGILNLEKQGDYKFIHKAQPTDPNDDTPLFHTYADAYLIADSVIYNSTSTKEYKERFNSMVNSCIACHQNFCMGPINKIELLRIVK